MNSYLREAARPWKLVTLAWGVGALCYGAATEGAPDWDVGVSLLMAGFAYATAPQAIRALEQGVRKLDWKQLILGLFLCWAGADGLYAAYWAIVDPVALALMREANFLASLCLYALTGYLWKPRCSLLDMLRALSTTLHLR